MFKKLNAFFIMFLLIFTSVAVAQEAEQEEPFGASETIEEEINLNEESGSNPELLRKVRDCTCDGEVDRVLVQAIKDINNAALLKTQAEEKFIVWYSAIQSVGGKSLFTVTKGAENFVIDSLDDKARQELMKLDEIQRKELIAKVYNEVFKSAFDDSIKARELSIKAIKDIQGLIDAGKLCEVHLEEAKSLIGDLDNIIKNAEEMENSFKEYRFLLGRYEVGRIEQDVADESVSILEAELYEQLIINVGGVLIAGPFINAALKFVFILGGRVLLFAGGRTLAGKAVAQGAEAAGGLVVPASEVAAQGGQIAVRIAGTDGAWSVCGKDFLARYARYLREVDAAVVKKAGQWKKDGLIPESNFDDLLFNMMLKVNGANRPVERELLKVLQDAVTGQKDFIIKILSN